MRFRKHSEVMFHSSVLGVLALVMVIVVIAGCTNPTTPQQTGPQGVLHQEIEIGGAALELIPIRRLAVSERGDIAIGQEPEGKVIIADSDGTVLAHVGGHGEGPGEFIGSPVFDWVGDSLYVGSQRLTVFGRDGGLLRTQRWVADRVLEENGVEYHPFIHGGILVGIVPPGLRVEYVPILPHGATFPPEFGSVKPGMAVTVTDSQGRVLGAYPVGPHTVPVGCRGVYCPRPLASVAAQQGLLLAAIPANPQPDSISYAIALIGIADSDTLFSVTRSYHRALIPPAVMDSLSAPDKSQPVRVDVASYSGGSVGSRPVSQGAWARAVDPEQPTTYPGLGHLLVGSDSTIWLEQVPSRVWEVLDHAGHPIGHLKLPVRSTLRAATRHKIWVVQRDSVDVPTVVRYGVSWEKR